MTNATELAKAALDREQAEREEKERKAEQELGEARERLASCLDAETWKAVGVDPRTLERAPRNYDFSYVVRGETEVDGERIKVAITMGAGFQSNRVAFGASEASSKNLGVPVWGSSLTDEEVEASVASQREENARQVGEVLLDAVFAIRRKREQHRQDEVRRIREKIEEAAKLYDRNAYERRQGVLRSALELARTSPDLLEADRGELVEAAEERLSGLAKAWEEQERKRAEAAAEQRERSLKILERLRIIDAEHRAVLESYEADCKDWAERETARLWRPWAGRKVRYVPRGVPQTISEYEEFSGEGPMSAASLVEEVFAFVSEGNHVGPITDGWVTVVERYEGSARKMLLGAILDEEMVGFDAPKTDEPLNYHRSYKSNGKRFRAFDYDGPGYLYVNVPPFVEDEPANPPEPPIAWSDRIEDLDLSALPEPTRGYARRGGLDFENYTCSQLADEAKAKESAGFYDSGDLPF